MNMRKESSDSVCNGSRNPKFCSGGVEKKADISEKKLDMDSIMSGCIVLSSGMEGNDGMLSPNDLAKTQGISSKTVNRYESAGLFDGLVIRLDNGYRQFLPMARERLAQIIYMKKAWGMKVYELKYVFSHGPGYWDSDEFYDFIMAVRHKHEKARAQSEGFVKNIDDYFRMNKNVNIGGTENMSSLVSVDEGISDIKAVTVDFEDIFAGCLDKACEYILNERLEENNGKLTVENAEGLYENASDLLMSLFDGMSYDGIPVEYFKKPTENNPHGPILKDGYLIMYSLEGENIAVNLYDIRDVDFDDGSFDDANDNDIAKVLALRPCFSCFMKKNLDFQPVKSADMYDELKEFLKEIDKPIMFS